MSLLLSACVGPASAPAQPTAVPNSTVAPKPTPTLTRVPPTADPSLGIGSTQVSDKDGMKLLYVPAGEFLMGAASSDAQAAENEKPQHIVYLDAFWIDQTEVTNAMYIKCYQAGACQAPSMGHSSSRLNGYYSNSQFANDPVTYVFIEEAKDYCEWAGRRLPTEAEWEKAARGTDGRMYPWGNDAPDRTRLNYNQEVGDTTQVGAYPTGASPYGALDMAGNVQEWVAPIGMIRITTLVSRQAIPPGQLPATSMCCGADLGTMRKPECPHATTGRVTTPTSGSSPSVFGVPAHILWLQQFLIQLLHHSQQLRSAACRPLLILRLALVPHGPPTKTA